MQLEIILSSADPADYDAQDLGFLLHKHPARVHVRATAQGVARVQPVAAGGVAVGAGDQEVEAQHAAKTAYRGQTLRLNK